MPEKKDRNEELELKKGSGGVEYTPSVEGGATGALSIHPVIEAIIQDVQEVLEEKEDENQGGQKEILEEEQAFLKTAFEVVQEIGINKDPEEQRRALQEKAEEETIREKLKDQGVKEKLLFLRSVHIREATVQDAPCISRLYNTVAITEENIEEKIDPFHPNSFKNTGGMFHACTVTEVEEYITHPEQYIVIVAEHDHQVIGAQICAKDAKAYMHIDALEIPTLHARGVEKMLLEELEIEGKLYDQKIQEHMAKVLGHSKTITGSIDLLVHPIFQKYGVIKLLKYRLFQELRALQKKYVFTEIYKITGTHNKKTGVRDTTIRLRNVASTKGNEGTQKNFSVGTMCVRHYHIGDWEITIDADIYAAHIENTIEAMEQEQKLRQRAWDMLEKEE
jgi:hypothetical protein